MMNISFKTPAVASYPVSIFCGLRRGYSDVVHGTSEVHDLVQKYVDQVGLCVTVTPTEYIYKDGNERGVIVGLINYPRFPSTPKLILNHAFAIAQLMLAEFGQLKVSIQAPDRTYMITKEDLETA